MFVRIIRGGDNTTILVATGHTKYWPVYSVTQGCKKTWLCGWTCDPYSKPSLWVWFTVYVVNLYALNTLHSGTRDGIDVARNSKITTGLNFSSVMGRSFKTDLSAPRFMSMSIQNLNCKLTETYGRTSPIIPFLCTTSVFSHTNLLYPFDVFSSDLSASTAFWVSPLHAGIHWKNQWGGRGGRVEKSGQC